MRVVSTGARDEAGGKRCATMRLSEIELLPGRGAVPDAVVALLADAQQRLQEFDARFQASIPAFVPSDFEQVYRALAWIDEAHLAAGRRFLEWGSGIGVVACLAAQLGFDAIGIEVEPALVEIAELIAADHGLDVEFACGSYVPNGAEPFVDTAGEVTWLRTDRPDSYADLDLEPEDFDLIFAYPWPGEEQVIFDLFQSIASVGSLLLTYHSQDGLRLQRKVRR
jgi:SAM-dependent methyltransferase